VGARRLLGTLGIATSPVWFGLWFGLALFVVYQTFVTLRVQSATFSKHPNVWQLMFAWLLPLVGVTIEHWFVTASFSEPLAPDRKFINRDSSVA
jgi:hypothetical protein